MKSHISNIKCPILIGLLFAGLLVGCRPKGILHSWEMRAVIVDLHKTDALLQECGLQYGHTEEVNIYYAQVLEKHGVTQAEFDSSLVWYTAHPQLFDKIYPKVVAQLTAEREAFDASDLARGETTKTPTVTVQRPALTAAQLDSTLWVAQHGYPTLWTPVPCYHSPLMHNAVD